MNPTLYQTAVSAFKERQAAHVTAKQEAATKAKDLFADSFSDELYHLFASQLLEYAHNPGAPLSPGSFETVIRLEDVSVNATSHFCSLLEKSGDLLSLETLTPGSFTKHSTSILTPLAFRLEEDGFTKWRLAINAGLMTSQIRVHFYVSLSDDVSS